MTDHLLEKQVLGVAALDDDLALLSLASPGTSCHLFHKLESAFVGTEVGEVHQSVGAKDAYSLYRTEIQSLGDHLCADEHVAFLLFEVLDDALVTLSGACRIGVHTNGTCNWEEPLQAFLNALGAISLGLELATFTLRTDLWPGHAIAAVMTFEGTSALVISERDVATRAVGCPAALHAFDLRRVASAVLEKNGLLTLLQRMADLLDEFGRKDVLGRDKGDLGQRNAGVTFGESYQSVLSLLGKIETLKTWRGAAQQHFGTMSHGKDDGRVASVITRGRILLLVTGLMFFIDDDESKLSEGKEDARTHTDDET